MKNLKISPLVLATIVYVAFISGLFLGRNQNQDAIVVSVPNSAFTMPTSEPETEATVMTEGVSFPISINEAGKEDFMALPGIGDVLAERIVAYRDQNGNFASLEELLNVEGIGKSRLEEILDLITIGG